MTIRALAMALLMMLASAAASYAANGYDVPVGATVTIDEHGECREVTNPAGQPASRFVSTRTAPEWQSVIANPNALTLAECAGGGSCEHDTFTQRETERQWRGFASSSDGKKLVTTVWGGQIYTSTDRGVTWTPRDSNRNWYGVASSADGTKLVAIVSGGQIYTSTNSGASWVARESNRNWTRISSSADGTRLAAIAGAQIYVSTNSGTSWTAYNHGMGTTVSSISASANGMKMVATTMVLGGAVYISNNGGTSWAVSIPKENIDYVGSAISADGTKIAVIGAAFDESAGYIGYSTNGGTTWNYYDPPGYRSWRSIAMSSDGSTLLASTYNDKLYMSTNAGATWAAKDSNRIWGLVVVSGDGSTMAAAAAGASLEKLFISGCDTGGGASCNGTYSNFTYNYCDGDTVLANYSGPALNDAQCAAYCQANAPAATCVQQTYDQIGPTSLYFCSCTNGAATGTGGGCPYTPCSNAASCPGTGGG
ncbi:MAG: hypothetical protein WC989_10025 [Micavibrio sp.]